MQERGVGHETSTDRHLWIPEPAAASTTTYSARDRSTENHVHAIGFWTVCTGISILDVGLTLLLALSDASTIGSLRLLEWLVPLLGISAVYVYVGVQLRRFVQHAHVIAVVGYGALALYSFWDFGTGRSESRVLSAAMGLWCGSACALLIEARRLFREPYRELRASSKLPASTVFRSPFFWIPLACVVALLAWAWFSVLVVPAKAG